MTEGPVPAAAPAAPVRAATPVAPVRAATPVAPVMPIVRRPVLASWSDFRAMVGIALVPVLAWLLMAVVIGLTFGHAVSANLGREFSPQALGDFNLDTIDVLAAWVGSVAMFASLTAGLGFKLIGTDGSGVSTGIAFAIAPIGTLAVLAIVTRSMTRRVFRRRPPFSIRDLFLRVTLIAVIGSAIMYVISAVAIMIVANHGTPPSVPPTGFLGGSLPKVVTGASPVPWSLVVVLFPTLLIGAAAGVLSLAPARAFVATPLMRFVGDGVAAVWEWLSPIGVAIRAYVAAVLLCSVVLVIGAAVWLLAVGGSTEANLPDAGAVLMAVPTLLAVGVNALLILALAVTGTMMDFGTGGSAMMRGALWQSDGWAIVAGMFALIVPPLLAGVWVRIHKSGTNPAQLIASAAAVWLVGVAGAILAGPTITTTSGPSNALGSSSLGSLSGAFGALSGGETTARLMPDLTQAALVGGGVVVLAMMLGFAIGSRFTRRPRAAAIPAVVKASPDVAPTAPSA